jgi:hypothetical protein
MLVVSGWQAECAVRGAVHLVHRDPMALTGMGLFNLPSDIRECIELGRNQLRELMGSGYHPSQGDVTPPIRDSSSVLVAGELYIVDDGRVVCGRHASTPARLTGLTRAGKPVEHVSMRQAAAWRANIGTYIRCQADGCGHSPFVGEQLAVEV